MPPVARHRAAALLITFALAALAGWFTASPPADGMSPGIPALTKQPAASTIPTSPAAPAKTRDAAIAALERAFALSLDPAAEVYSGERFMELCRGDFPSDVPGGSNEACFFASRWAEKDPQGMFEWFLAQGKFTALARGTNCTFLSTVFQGWANKDAPAAVNAVLRCRVKFEQGEAMTAIIEELFKADPTRAAAIGAQQLKILSGAPFSLNAYGKDFAEKWTFLHGLPAGKDRGTILARYFDEVSRYHAADSERLWREAPEDIRRELVAGGFVASWAGHDDKVSGKPPAFDGLADLHREHAETTGDRKDAWHFLDAHGKAWAQSDPAAAVAWSLAHLKGEWRVKLTTQLFTDAATHDFDAALRTWQSLPDGILRARAAGRIAAAASESREEEVNALLATLPPGDQAIAQSERKQAPAQRQTSRRP